MEAFCVKEDIRVKKEIRVKQVCYRMWVSSLLMVMNIDEAC